MTSEASDDDIRAWIERHDLGGCGTLTDMRAAFEDAQSFTAERAVAPPAPRKEPDIALLASMATCLNHGFGLLDAAQQEPILANMRKLWDEVMGYGFYRTSHRARYQSMVAAAPQPPEGARVVDGSSHLYASNSAETRKAKYPRRRVVESDAVGDGVFRYNHSCGHVVQRVGRVPRGRAMEAPTDTATCYECGPIAAPTLPRKEG